MNTKTNNSVNDTEEIYNDLNTTTESVDWEDKYKRALADYQNLIRQQAREREGFIRFANQNLISDLLPILDHLRVASLHVQDTGIEMVLNEFSQLLSSYQVEVINPQLKDEFNHELHECIDIVYSQDEVDNTIAEVLNLGYRWTGGLVIRHAQVKVFKSDKNT